MSSTVAEPTTRSAIAVDDLRVRRGGRLVLDGLTTSMPEGSITGLLGPSGCGKSTLMRAVTGVQRVEGGTVRVLGEPAGSPRLRSRVAYVTQAPSVYADLTVAENLAYFARVLGAPAADVERAVAAVGLDAMATASSAASPAASGPASRWPPRCWARPEVLVLDEPTVGLDPVLRRDLWALFRRLADDGATLLVSSHVMDEAVRCDRLLLMRDGRLLAAVTPAELLHDTGAADVEAAFLALVEDAR